MMKIILFVVAVLIMMEVAGQSRDSVKVLEEVTIKAYEANRPILQVPAAIGLITTNEFNRFSNASIVNVANTIPGIRMEERSPGSYRFSIRGSSLRSPFGVRNVKVYWNGLPLTDPGGNTYLNQLDPNAISQLEIIKGPGSSLYGAGTGGVILMQSPQPSQESKLSASYMGGSYGLKNYQLNFLQGGESTSHYVGYQHQEADGYRQQTRMVRDQLNSTFQFNISDKEKLETAIFYTDLYYQTPGGLTLTEFQTDSRQARPRAGTQPGAAEQQASVALKSFYTGVSHQYQFSSKLKNKTGVYGNFVQFENPAIRNYERRLEQNLGARTVTEFETNFNDWKVTLQGGGEFQRGYSPVKNYQNLQGYPGALQNDDEIKTLQYSIFGQGEVNTGHWIYSGGLSLNWVSYSLLRLTQSQAIPQSVNYDPVITPRLAVLRKINSALSVYGNLSWGFSPPTLAEIRPSNNVFNTSLESETGRQIEIGAKGYLLNRKLWIDLAAYSFQLDQSIVVRRDTDGADYFVNAGGTDQKGFELMINYQPISQGNILSQVKIWSGTTLNDYQFKDYIKNTTSFSGNQLTGTPKYVLTGGADVQLFDKFMIQLTINHTAEIPLDDANTVYSNAYTLVGAKVSYQHLKGKLPFEVFAGGDNLLDEVYSLGNDLNAAAGRYYNTAYGRNFFGGIKINFDFRRIKRD